MSEENRHHDNAKAENNNEFDTFFEHYDPEIEMENSSIEQDVERIDTNSRKENATLFGGDLKDIEAYLKHEEIRLKFLEFKLKKKTRIKEDKSTYKDKRNERKLRKENAKKAFWFSCIWAIFIAIFIILHAVKTVKLPFLFSTFEFTFVLKETEFIFVCGTLTASILIFYLTVIKNLFPNKPDPVNTNNNNSLE
ncbi:hypothetical protein [Elizabethkingia anophelis]|uniref:hypothetical protein n=1 Tax=Elizabethkingia anophelis TaxID=1117645 RepID=UPI002925CF4E|nr:MAG: hypothetical protein PQ275_09010 [Elizabethkingia anophelis]